MITANENLSEHNSTVNNPWGKGENLTGKTFNRLTVISYAGRDAFKKAEWLCKCQCGNEKVIAGSCIKSGHTSSCGCAQLEAIRKVSRTHGCNGKSGKTREYNTWSCMIQRCVNPKYTDYHNYGGRGIKVCKRWRFSFENFLKDMGPRPEGMSIDRKDNNKDYSPDNCKWATRTEQNNNRRDCRIIEYQGKRQTIAKWSRDVGLEEKCLRNRLNNYGWSVERALTTPSQRPKKTIAP